MVRPRFGAGRYGCCGVRKPAGETANYCPACKRAYMDQWRAAHHRRGDPYYERQLARGREAGKARTRERREDRVWRARRVQIAIGALNAAGVGCQEIARRLGVAEDSVYFWRSGRVTPIARNAERLFHLADAIEEARAA